MSVSQGKDARQRKRLPSETRHIPDLTTTVACHVVLFNKLYAVIDRFSNLSL